MCVIKRVFKLNVTKRDKLDIAMTSTVLGDCLWFINDKFLHSFILDCIVFTLLFVGLAISTHLLVQLIMKHHKQYIRRHTRIIDPPTIKHSER